MKLQHKQRFMYIEHLGQYYNFSRSTWQDYLNEDCLTSNFNKAAFTLSYLKMQEFSNEDSVYTLPLIVVCRSKNEEEAQKLVVSDLDISYKNDNLFSYMKIGELERSQHTVEELKMIFGGFGIYKEKKL